MIICFRISRIRPFISLKRIKDEYVVSELYPNEKKERMNKFRMVEKYLCHQGDDFKLYEKN